MKPTALTFERNVTIDVKQSVVIALLAACKSLDVMKVHELVEDDAIFIKEGKYEFLAVIGGTFNKCIADGVKGLKQYHAVCRLCFSKTVIAAFKDSAEQGRLGLYFQPMISNPVCISICTRFSSTDGVYNDEVHFAPDNLTEPEWHYHAQIIDSGIIPEHLKKQRKF